MRFLMPLRPPATSPLSLHDALPIAGGSGSKGFGGSGGGYAKPAAAPKAASGLSSKDRKWQLKAANEEEWMQWLQQQKAAAGISADAVYVQVRRRAAQFGVVWGAALLRWSVWVVWLWLHAAASAAPPASPCYAGGLACLLGSGCIAALRSLHPIQLASPPAWHVAATRGGVV